MAKKGLFSFLILALFLSTMSAPIVMVPNEAHAQKRPQPKPFKCLALARQIGASRVWWGRHVGSREGDKFFSWGPKKDYFDQIGCFKSRKDCEDWLYWMRSDYPEFSFHKPCRRGL